MCLVGNYRDIEGDLGAPVPLKLRGLAKKFLKKFLK